MDSSKHLREGHSQTQVSFDDQQKGTKNWLRAAALRVRFTTRSVSATISKSTVVTVLDLDGGTIDIRYAR